MSITRDVTMVWVPYQVAGIVYFKVRLVPLYVVAHTSKRNRGIVHLESANLQIFLRANIIPDMRGHESKS